MLRGIAGSCRGQGSGFGAFEPFGGERKLKWGFPKIGDPNIVP